MGIALWVVLFLVLTGVCAWVALGEGLETVAGLVFSQLLGADISRWTEQGIRVFVALTWVLLAIWFLLGLFDPAFRL